MLLPWLIRKSKNLKMKWRNFPTIQLSTSKFLPKQLWLLMRKFDIKGYQQRKFNSQEINSLKETSILLMKILPMTKWTKDTWAINNIPTLQLRNKTNSSLKVKLFSSEVTPWRMCNIRPWLAPQKMSKIEVKNMFYFLVF